MRRLTAALFVLASLALRFLGRRWMTAGAVYGVAIFFVMNYAVLPLSAVGIKNRRVRLQSLTAEAGAASTCPDRGAAAGP